MAALTGIGILFLWLFTNHDMTQNNYNILWANPLLLTLVCFKKLKARTKLIIHKIVIISILLIPIVAISGLQAFNYTLYPLITTLLLLLVKSHQKSARA
jgi:hypothetical protein